MPLQTNRDYYENALEIAKILFEQGLFEDCVNYIQQSAKYSWSNFTGHYTGYQFEVILAEIANLLIKTYPQKQEVKSKQKKLHVFTEIFKIGGHTRLMFNWIERDQKSDHYILSTKQSRVKVEEIIELFEMSSSIKELFILDNSNIKAAQQLLNIALEGNFDQIILHIDPQDSIPILAFSNTALQTPVLFLNHADHTFWLGASVADIVIQIRESNIQLDSERRQISVDRQKFLPIPVKKRNKKKHGQNQPITLLSIGSGYKYKPTAEYNFFKEMKEVVERFPNVICYIVGVDKNNVHYQMYAHPSIICTGVQTDVNCYIEKADMYVEGFPFPSFTALLEASLSGIPFVLHYNPTSSLKLFEEKPDYFLKYPRDSVEWHKMINRLIEEKHFREYVAVEQLRAVNLNYSENSWYMLMDEIDVHVKNIIHAVHPKELDVFKQSRDEQVVLESMSAEFNYYSYTRNLNLINKLKIIFKNNSKNANVIKYSFKQIISYLIKKY